VCRGEQGPLGALALGVARAAGVGSVCRVDYQTSDPDFEALWLELLEWEACAGALQVARAAGVGSVCRAAAKAKSKGNEDGG